MKKLLTLAAVLALSLVTAATALAAPLRLTYSNFFPPTHVQSKLAEEWCREVERRTGGAVVIDYFPGGTLTPAQQTYDGVVEGIADIGLSCLAYSRGRFPVMAALDLPLGYTSAAQATAAANAVHEKYSPAELTDVAPMYFHAHGPGLLFTTPRPVATLEDLKGLKIRSTGNSAQLVEALGGTPVAQSMPTCYQSLQKGVVDGSIHPLESNKGWKLAEVVKYGTESFPVAYTTTFFVVMNKAKWQRLDEATRAVIGEINAEWAVRHGAAWDEADQEGRDYFLEKGGSFVPLADAEAARWVEAAQPVIAAYEKATASRGLDGPGVVAFLRAAMDEAK
ncbi:C4-dicarboxylate ABC transporter substrate-binding protein [Pseudodesulfovibrio sp. F-1]|uniref:C4-dicarboxylate ABC transporter substrate-binding protein n=1 Tax=Pseudodesulfovibrio alkaliphilus TaxID=2661613 RepID=A0A7K1KM84_9BACT|nr:TRAP transporter substrate-binding protein [Pseudodesulfovibrio alkaliphilus]MUM77150.1 C4-dicarboxylate ABC transporter substrate-binding protein [Pseudodesulfovibrio alkaliphilus]